MSSPVSPVQILTQALQQLAQSSASKPLPNQSLLNQAAHVVVTQLRGNQLQIQSKNSQAVTLPLPSASQSSQLNVANVINTAQATTPIQAKVVQQNQQPFLQLFTQTQSNPESSGILNQPKIVKAIRTLVDANSALTPSTKQALPNPTQVLKDNGIQIDGQKVQLNVVAKVLQSTLDKAKLQINFAKQVAEFFQLPKQNITLSIEQTKPALVQGQAINIVLKQLNSTNWSVSLAALTKIEPSTQNTNITATNFSKADQQLLNKISQYSEQNIRQTTTPQNIPQSASISKLALLSSLSQFPATQAIIERIKQVPEQKIRINLNPQKVDIVLPNIGNEKVLATIPLTDKQKVAVKALLAQAAGTVTPSTNTQNSVTSESNTLNAAVRSNETVLSQPNTVSSKAVVQSHSLGQVATLIAQLPKAEQTQLKQFLDSSIVLSQRNQEPLPNVVQQLQQQLSKVSIQSNPGSVDVIEELIDVIKQQLPSGKTTDPQAVKNLLSQPSILPQSLLNQAFVPQSTEAKSVRPVQSNNLVETLVQLFTASVTSQINAQTPAQTSLVQSGLVQLLSSILKSVKQNPNIAGQKASQLNQVEQQTNLTKQIAKLLSGHQMQKLASTELSTQGQDALYYVIPSAFGNQFKNIELMIKREPDKENSERGDQQNGGTWHLTMKLSIGEQGDALAKVKLFGQDIDLHLYVESDELQKLILRLMPLLEERLQSLGLSVNVQHCLKGKIPENLYKRPYNLFETKA